MDWASLGTAIGNLLGNAIAGIDYVGIGETFAGFVNGVFTAVLNFSKTFPWKDIATNFANGVNTALKNSIGIPSKMVSILSVRDLEQI